MSVRELGEWSFSGQRGVADEMGPVEPGTRSPSFAEQVWVSEELAPIGQND
jgi:hypothetical protein